MLSAILISAIAFSMMLLPYLPGRFDASAAALSYLSRIASYASLLFTPLGLACIYSRRRSRLWRRLGLALVALIAFITAVAAAAINQLAIGLMIGVGGLAFLGRARRALPASPARLDGPRHSLPLRLALLPIFLVAFQATVLPPAAEWSRSRAIEHSAPLIAEIEAFRQRRGHYPVSLQSLNRDVPTGVVGIERFLYEPSGETYNLFFVRPHLELDAREVVIFNPRDEHRFTSHELDLLQYEGANLDLRRGDRRRSPLPHPHWISILFD